MWWWAKKAILEIFKGQIVMFFNWKGVSIKQISRMNIILCLTGQIETFRGPHGPYVAHACCKQMPKHLVATCLYYWVEMCKNAFLHECKIEFVIFVYLKNDKLYFLISPGRIVAKLEDAFVIEIRVARFEFFVVLSS